MSFSNLFDSGFRKRNQNHFAAIVRVAMDDGAINDEEKLFLDRLARKLNISESDYESILKDYNSHPINPPTSYDRRLERLYDLSRMVYVENIKNESKHHLLEKIAVGLGFSTKNVKYIVDKALTLINEEDDLESFIEEMKTMNR